MARARTPSNSPIHVAQELRERAIRIVKSGGASNVIMAEKALPKCHPNLLLLLSNHSTTRCGGGRSCDRGCASCGRLFLLGILSSSGDKGNGEGDGKGGRGRPTHPPTGARAVAADVANAVPGGVRARS